MVIVGLACAAAGRVEGDPLAAGRTRSRNRSVLRT